MTGGRPLYYQWYFQDGLLPQATNSSLTLAGVQFSTAGEYHVVVSNSLGAATSRVARLTVGFGLTVTNQGLGTTVISPALASYDPGSRVELRAVADSGRRFLRWSGDIAATANPLGVTLNGHLSIVAEFSHLPGDILWSFDVGSGGGYPAIGPDGTIYVGGRSVFALNGITGEKKWEFAEAAGTTVVAPDGTVVVAAAQPYVSETSTLKVYALDGGTGAKRWDASFSRPGYSLGSWPAIGGVGLIYVTVSDTIYGLDALTGSTRWSSRVAGFLSSPVLGEDGTLYLTFGNYFGVCALDGQTGRESWRVGQGGVGPDRRQSPPVVGAHNIIYIGDFSPGGPPPAGYAYLHALDGATGVIKWNGPGALSYLGISEDGTLFAVMGMDLWNPFDDMVTTSLGAYSAETGQIRWGLPSWRGPFSGTSAPTIAKDGTLYVAMNHYAGRPWLMGGSLKALEGGTGRTNWSFGVTDPVDGQPGTSFASAALGPDGTVYAGCANGMLYALEGSGRGLAESPWPTARGNPRNTGQAYTVFPRVSEPGGGGLYFEGSPVELRTEAKGPSPMSLQWRLDGRPIPGATNATWKIDSISSGDAGSYGVLASNAYASVISVPAVVSVYNVVPSARPVLRFTAPSGTPLQVQYVENLGPSAAWGPLADLTLPANPYGFADSTATSVGQRFYRTTQKDPLGIHVLPAWTFDAPVGSLHRIEYVDEATGLANWQFLTNLTLPTSPYLFIDLSATDRSPRYYRTTPLP